MTQIEMIEALCKAGTTENKGVYYAPSQAKDIRQSIKDMFGETSILDGVLEVGFAYLYSYDERLTNERGEVGADAVVTNSDNDNIDHIYLYSIGYVGD